MPTVISAAPFSTEELLAEIRSWVEIESPTSEPAAVNRAMDKVEADATRAGMTVRRFPGERGFGDHILVGTPWGPDEPGILLLSHLDTVHPKGTLAAGLPFRVEGDAAYGPGICDMKGGALIGFAAMREQIRSGRTDCLPVRQLFVSDEEDGSPTSRAIIEAEARRARYVLVTEAAREGGRIVTARKGVARFDLKVTGRAAHSGSRHQDGRSALRELARQILDIEAMTDYETGVTVSVGRAGGGTVVNVVPEHAFAEIDMRVPNPQIGDAAVARILAIKPYDPDCTLTIAGGINRPGYEKSPEIEALFQHARGLAAEIGFELNDLKTGGGSDGNFTAAIAPTLDGLGVDGAAAHSHNERLFISSIVPRAMLLLRLMETLR